MLGGSDRLLTLMYQRFQRVSVVFISFWKIVIFRKDVGLLGYIIALFGLFWLVSAGLVYSSSLHLYRGMWCWSMLVWFALASFRMKDYEPLFIHFLRSF